MPCRLDEAGSDSSRKVKSELVNEIGGVRFSTDLEFKVERTGDGLGLSVRESLIIEDRKPGPLRRSARLRAPVQRLELSDVGIQRDEISEEDFERELHHALESSVSDLSASVLADVLSEDETFQAGMEATESSSQHTSTSSIAATDGEEESAFMSLGDTTLHSSPGGVSSRSASSGDEDSDSSRSPSQMGPVNFKLKDATSQLPDPVPREVHKSDIQDQAPVSTVPPDLLDQVAPPDGLSDKRNCLTVNVQIKISNGDADDIGEILGDWRGVGVPADMSLNEICAQLYRDCRCLQRLQHRHMSDLSGFRRMFWRQDNYWFERGGPLEDPSQAVRDFEHEFNGSASGEARLCYKLIPYKFDSVFSDRTVDVPASERLLHILGTVPTSSGTKEVEGN